MAIQFRVDPIERAAKVLLTGLEEARRDMAAQFAREEIARAEAINAAATGSKPKYTVSVDGHVGAPLESVNLNHGEIDVEFNLAVDVLKWIAQRLKARSPYRSGRFIGAQIMLADGMEVSPYGRIPPADQYVFLDTAPYAAKIEAGKTKSGRTFTFSDSNARVYWRTAEEARAKFGREIADINYGFTSLAHAYTFQTHGRRRRIGGRQRNAAIFVRLKGF